MAVQRLHNDWKSMLVEPPPLCYAEPMDRDIFNWRAIIFGPPKSPFEGTAIFIDIFFSRRYPYRPPKIRFIHPIYHPNISENGQICADVLAKAWSPSFTIPKILISITSILSDPHFEGNPYNPDAASMYNNDPQNYNRLARDSCQNHFSNPEFKHFYFKLCFWQFGNGRKKLMDFFYEPTLYNKILVEDLSYPNDRLDQNWAIIDKEAFNFIPSELLKSKPKMKRLYSLITAAENDIKDWFNSLLLTENIEFIENNVEYRLCNDLENKQLWELYFQFLREKDSKKLLQMYSLFCRFFVEDLEVLEKYKNAVEEFGPSLVPWKDPFDFEIFDQNVEFSTITPKTKEPISCYFTSNFVFSQNFPFKAHLMDYIVTKCSSKLLQKLNMSCKHFFAKFAKPVCYRLEISNEPEKVNAIEYKESSATINKLMAPNSNFQNIYIAKILTVNDHQDQLILSKCLSCISQCHAKYITILKQKLTEAELKFLICSKKVVELNLWNTKIVDADKNKIGLEEILKFTPELKRLFTDCIKYTPQTAEIIADLPFKNKIQQFRCDELSNENFEPQTFAEFVEKNADKRAKFGVHFLGSVDENFKRNFIDTVRNHILETFTQENRPEIILCV